MEEPDIADFLREPFDFLIVGGGTAGLVVANRLTKYPNIQVGVIEAGLSRLGDPKVDMPSGVGMMLSNPEYDWNFSSVAQKATKDRVYHLPRGKLLGGSSGINFMAYGRPCARDLDDWADALGLEGWSWADMLPYFKRSERLESDQPNIRDRDAAECPLNEDIHGSEGFIHTSLGVWQAPLEKDLLKALDETSRLPRPSEPYGGSHLGFYRSIFSIDRTETPVRSYSTRAYLSPISKRRNLRVLTDATVRKITLDRRPDGSLMATGIVFSHNGSLLSITAKKEVILCAGSFQSPQLLEISGIGNPKVLERAQIPCVLANEHIGSNLQEHTMCAVVYELADGGMSLDSLFLDAALAKEHQRLYKESQIGALSGAVSLTGFVPYLSQVGTDELEETLRVIESPGLSVETFQLLQRHVIAARMRSPDSADIQVVGTPANFNIREGYSNCAKLMSGAPPGHNACYSLVVSNMYPLSRGTVHVKSSDPLESPLIDPGFLSDSTDVDVLAAAIQFADRVFCSELISNKVARRVEPSSEIDLGDADAVRAFVRENIVSYHHALGTCAMGQVVDERLRVKEVSGLRVVDASVLPMQVSAPILATVYAVAEKASDMIIQDYEIDRIDVDILSDRRDRVR